MTLPDIVARVTKHKKPRYQLYQPGFVAQSSQWIEGDWLTLPKEKWEAEKEHHERLYAQQPHDDTRSGDWTATAPDDMTEAQLQAYNYFSGWDEISCRDAAGHVTTVGIELAGGHITAEKVDWLKQNDLKVLRLVEKDGVVDQAAKYQVPDELVLNTDEPVNFWMEVVDQNMRRAEEAFDDALKAIVNEADNSPELKQGLRLSPESYRSMCYGLLWFTLVEAEQGFIDPDSYFVDKDKERARYIRMRRSLAEKLPGWEALYQAYKKKDSVNGKGLPEFDANGNPLP